MEMLILYSLLHILFILVDIVSIYKDNKRKLLLVYSILWFSSYIIFVLISVNVKIPSPALAIKKLVALIYGL